MPTLNKNILPAAVAFLLATGTLFAAEKTMVKEKDETRAPKVLSALKKFDTLLEENAYDVKFFTLKEESQCENPVVFLNGLSGYCGSAGDTKSWGKQPFPTDRSPFLLLLPKGTEILRCVLKMRVS